MKERYKTQSEMNKSKQLKFQYQTDLFRDICAPETLREAFKSVKRNKGAPGVDGITIEKYEETLEENLNQLRKEVNELDIQTNPGKTGGNTKTRRKRSQVVRSAYHQRSSTSYGHKDGVRTHHRPLVVGKQFWVSS
jgi:retron-type reverse transcriptase